TYYLQYGFLVTPIRVSPNAAPPNAARIPHCGACARAATGVSWAQRSWWAARSDATAKGSAPMRSPTGSSATATVDASELTRRAIERRAVEAVIWGMPAVNFDLMYQAMVRETQGAYNQIVYWSRLPDWKNQTLTPNPDAIYLMPFFNTKDAGPVVLEIPP